MIIIFLLLFYTFHKGRLIEGAQNDRRSRSRRRSRGWGRPRSRKKAKSSSLKRKEWANRLAKNPVNWTNNVIRISRQFRKAVGKRNRKHRSALAGKLKALCVAGQQQQPKLDWPNTEDAVVVASRLRLERYGCKAADRAACDSIAAGPVDASGNAAAGCPTGQKLIAGADATLCAGAACSSYDVDTCCETSPEAKAAAKEKRRKEEERLAMQQRIDTMHNKLIAAKVNTIVEEKLDPVLTAWCPRWCEKRRT